MEVWAQAARLDDEVSITPELIIGSEYFSHDTVPLIKVEAKEADGKGEEKISEMQKLLFFSEHFFMSLSFLRLRRRANTVLMTLSL